MDGTTLLMSLLWTYLPVGIIYSTNAGGAKQMPETNNLNQT